MTATILYVLGFGGHARSVADVALGAGYTDLTFIDPNARPDESFAGHPVLAAMPDRLQAGAELFSALGDNSRRQIACETVTALPLATLIASTSHLGKLSKINSGTFVGHSAHVGPQASIGSGVILNTASVVEHECFIGDFTHVSVNATVAGRCRIGSRVMLGAGSVVIDSISICDDVVVAAGAVVVSDISSPGTYVGVPARRIDR